LAVNTDIPFCNDLLYNSLVSTCTCHYLFVGTNVSQCAISSKLNFLFVSSLIIPYCGGHNSFIRREFKVHEYLMERIFFDNLSNISGPISISRHQGFQMIKTLCCCFCRVLLRCRGFVIHIWDPGPSWSTPQTYGGGVKRCPRTSSSLATTLEDQQGRSSQVGGPNQVDFESVSESMSSLHQNGRHGRIPARIWYLFI